MILTGLQLGWSLFIWIYVNLIAVQLTVPELRTNHENIIGSQMFLTAKGGYPPYRRVQNSALHHWLLQPILLGCVSSLYIITHITHFIKIIENNHIYIGILYMYMWTSVHVDLCPCVIVYVYIYIYMYIYIYHIMFCHVMSCYVMSCHVMLYHVMLCHVMVCHVM